MRQLGSIDRLQRRQTEPAFEEWDDGTGNGLAIEEKPPASSLDG